MRLLWVSTLLFAVLFGTPAAAQPTVDAENRPESPDADAPPEIGSEAEPEKTDTTTDADGGGGPASSLGPVEKSARGTGARPSESPPPSAADDPLGSSSRKRSAGEAPSEPPTTGSELGSLLLQTLVVLVAVCLLAYVVLRWGVGRLFGARNSGDEEIEILARKPIGSDKSIMIVRVGPRTLIVGETNSGMNRLGELDESEAEAIASADEQSRDDGSASEPAPFRSYLDWKGESE